MASLSGITIQQDGIGHILADTRLKVPVYQRAYAWTKTHVQDLFDDLTRAIDGEGKDYFLGSIVACTTSDQILEIVDGQQRLATTSILIAAMRDHLATIGEKETAGDITREYLRKTEGIRNRMEHPRLTLSENDQDFFAKAILAEPSAERDKLKGSRPSHKLLQVAVKLAKKKVADIVAGRKTPDQLTVLEKWLHFLKDKAKVVFIKVPDHGDAFVIFETLNDRGLELSIADLTKNYIFGRSGDRIEGAKQNWNRMVGMLEAVSDRDITKFYIHALWSSIHGVTRDRELFNRMRERIHSQQQAIDFSESLADNAQKYAALRNADHEFWNSYGSNTKRHIHTLNHLRVAQIRMLLIAVLDRFSQNDIKKVLSDAVCWSVRFMIAGGATGNLETYYATRAVRIRSGEIKNASDLARSMATDVPNDDQFRASFTVESVSADYLARYYLACLEKANIDESCAHLGSDDENVGSLEHILPKSPDPKVWKLDEATVEELRYKIGNLALLARTENIDRGNGSFEDAKPYYAKSKFTLTRELAEIRGEWNGDKIAGRQGKMAYLAVKAWPLRIEPG